MIRILIKEFLYFRHRLITVTDRRLDVVFSSTPKELRVVGVEKTCSLSCNSTESEPVVLRRLRITPLGFCLRVNLNKRHINPEKTTSSVPSVTLINL